MIKRIVNIYLTVLFIPVASFAYSFDTASTLRKLISDLKDADNMTYKYVMSAKFPNGSSDRVEGKIYLDLGNKFYYNDCNAFTMLYSEQWFYKADHINKTIEIIDLTKEKDKQLRKKREENIFKKGALSTFLDSVMLKKGILKQMGYEGNVLKIAIRFPKTISIKAMSIDYDTLNDLPVNFNMTLRQQVSTSVGTEITDMNVNCSNFQKENDKSLYREDMFFLYTKNKLSLKKYENYKLLPKI